MNDKVQRAFFLIGLHFLACNLFSAGDCHAQQVQRTSALIRNLRSRNHDLAHHAAIDLRRKGEEGVRELVRLIDDPEVSVRYFAAYGLGNGEVDSRSMQAILQRLNNETHPAVVCALLQALEDVSTDIEKPASIVSRYLKSEKSEVRQQATRTLTKFKSTDPVIKEMLFSLLSDQNRDCRLEASQAVAQMALSREDIDKMESRIFSEDCNAQYNILYAIIDNKPLAAYFIDKFPKSVGSFEYIPSLITGLLSDTDDDLQAFRTRLKDSQYLPAEVMVRLGERRYAKILRARAKEATGQTRRYLLASAWAIDHTEPTADSPSPEKIVQGAGGSRQEDRGSSKGVISGGCGFTRIVVAGKVLVDGAVPTDSVVFSLIREDGVEQEFKCNYDEKEGWFHVFLLVPFTRVTERTPGRVVVLSESIGPVTLVVKSAGLSRRIQVDSIGGLTLNLSR